MGKIIKGQRDGRGWKEGKAIRNKTGFEGIWKEKTQCDRIGRETFRSQKKSIKKATLINKNFIEYIIDIDYVLNRIIKH